MGLRDLQSADERESRYIFTAVEYFDKLVLEVADVRLEAVTLPYLDREEVVVVLLSLPARSILSDERLGYLLEILERM